MAFEKAYFSDGDAIYQTPEWRKKLETIDNEVGAVSFSSYEEDKRSIQENEVALKHPENGSYLRINDDGSIEAFTAYGTGFRINANNTSQFFSDRIQLIGRETAIRTTPNGTNLNGEILGAEAYQSFPSKKGLSRSFLQEANKNGIETYGLEENK